MHFRHSSVFATIAFLLLVLVILLDSPAAAEKEEEKESPFPVVPPAGSIVTSPPEPPPFPAEPPPPPPPPSECACRPCPCSLFPFTVRSHSPDGSSIDSTPRVAHISSEGFAAGPLPDLALAVCEHIVVPGGRGTRADHRRRCVESVLGALEDRAAGRDDGETARNIDFFDMPFDNFSDSNSSVASTEDGLSHFLVLLEPPISEAEVVHWSDSTPEMIAVALEKKMRVDDVRIGYKEGELVRMLDGDIALFEKHIEETTGAIAMLDDSADPETASKLEKRLVDLKARTAAKKKDRDAALDPNAAPRSFFADVDAVFRTLPFVSPQSTVSGFIHPSLYLRGPALSSPKGRGVWTSAAIPAWTMIELSPALLVPALTMRLSDERKYPDAPVYNSLLDYAFPAPQSIRGDKVIESYSLLPLGWAMLYNHCSEEDENTSWESVRYGLEKATIPNRFSSFATRFFTTKDVKAGEELCWNYGKDYWSANLPHRSQEP